MEQKFNSIRWVFSLLVIGLLFCPASMWAQGPGTKTYPHETLAARVIKLSKDYKVNVMYNPGQKDISVPELTVNAHDINGVLDKTLASTDFTYKKTAETSYVIVKKTNESQQEASGKGILSGVVLDEKGIPVIGATVVVKGTTTGTATDADGKFVIMTSRGAHALTVSGEGIESFTNNVTVDGLGLDLAAVEASKAAADPPGDMSMLIIVAVAITAVLVGVLGFLRQRRK